MTTPPGTLPDLIGLDTFKLWPGVVVEAGQEPSALFVLTSASAYVRLESGNPQRWPDPATVPAAVRSVAVQVAARAWRNPSCSATVVTGPFTDTFAQGIEDALYLSDVERGVIDKLTARPALWTMQTTRGDDEFADPYRDPFSGEYIGPTPRPSGDDLYGGWP